MIAFTTQRVVIEVPEHTLGCQEPKTFKKCSHKKHIAIDHYRKYHNIPQCSLFVTPKLCLSIVFSFSWGHCNSQEKLKTMFLQMLGWQTKSIMVCYGIFCSGQCPWRGEEIKDSHGVKGLANQCAVLWCRRDLWVDLPCSLYVRKEHQTNNEPQNCVKWWWIEPRLHRKSNNRPKFT